MIALPKHVFKIVTLTFVTLAVFFYTYGFTPSTTDTPSWASDRHAGLSSSLNRTIPLDPASEEEKDNVSTETNDETIESSTAAKPATTHEVPSKLADISGTQSKPPSAKSSSKGADAGKVLMVTASSGTGGFLGIPHMKERVYENRMAYADRHGYEHMWANITTYNLSHGEPIYWNKIPVLQEAFIRYPHVEWVWWMDMDIIIMNHSLSIWDHVLSPEGMARNAVLNQTINKPGGGPSGWRTPPSYNHSEVNFIIASGGWGMNIGNFLMRRSYWSEWLLDLWIDPFYIKEFTTFPENDGWTHMYRHHPIVRTHTVCTNQRALNAYPSYNSLGEHWQPGDFAVHFAGCGASPTCPGHWDEYWDKKESYEVPPVVKEKLADGTAEIENVQKGIGMPAGTVLDAVPA
ncbi:MAG: hypothetical protein Q9200_003861 [Gallowayella weberi]